MHSLTDWYYATADFLTAGGPVLKVLALVIGLLWLLTFERLFYLGFTGRHLSARLLSEWYSRGDLQSWNSQQVRDAMQSRLNDKAWSSIPIINALVALCPLLGLLGTVSGMITIFDVMAINGTSNARSMAEGVSRATIPTMAGMVAALAGVAGATLVARQYDGQRISTRDAFDVEEGIAGRHIKLQRPVFKAPVRLLVSALLAILTVAALLTLMQVLISTGKSAITETQTFYFTDFIRIPKEQPLQKKDRRIKKPEAVEKPPEFTPRTESVEDLVGDNVISVAAPSVSASNADLRISGLGGLSGTDGDYLPIVKVQAMYPRSAVSRGLEGYVIVRFTVTTNGSVRDPIVVESSSPIFEGPALRAALKFKYKPRVVDGKPIEVHGVENKITFEIID